MLLKWICFITFLAAQTEALRVLVVFAFTSPSHNLLGRAVVRHLLEAKHEVVYITSSPDKNPITNLTEISIEALGEQILKERENDHTYSVQHLVGKDNPGDSILQPYYLYDFHKRALGNDNLTKFLSDPKEQFDIVLMEWFFSDLFAGIPSLFNCPFIWIGSTDAHWQVLSLAGEVTNPAHTPDIFGNSPPTNLWERTCALLKLVKKYIASKVVIGTAEKIFYNTYYSGIAAKRGVSMPPYDEVVNNASMVFINSHPTMGLPLDLPLNVKYVGGYHINSNLKPTPKRLQNIMDNAKHGVIYFSLGTNLESKFMSREMIQSLLEMFSKLKQAVVWKFEDDLQDVPVNVYLERWAPQLNILAHPNLRVFITHGGRMSLTEAVYYGVPVIGIPVYGDQFVNIKQSVMKKVGIEVPLREELAEDLLVAIREILDNSMYKNAAREMSTFYHHSPITPGQELVYWVEHTVQSRGALYLRSPARKLRFYQKMYLDLLLVVIVFSIFLFVFVRNYLRQNVGRKEKTS